MTDVFTKEKRREVMSGIKNKDTKIENMVRSWLFLKGYRYRKNDKRLPGKPDIVLPKYRTVIFVNGCFWHRHEGCKYAYTPKTRSDFWITKISGNVERDKSNIAKLNEMGWNVIIVWECELKRDPQSRLDMLLDELQN